MQEFRTSGSLGASGEQSPEATRPEVPVNGQQERSAYNGHFESVYYHPLLLFDGKGDCLAAKLWAGILDIDTLGMMCAFDTQVVGRNRSLRRRMSHQSKPTMPIHP